MFLMLPFSDFSQSHYANQPTKMVLQSQSETHPPVSTNRSRSKNTIKLKPLERGQHSHLLDPAKATKHTKQITRKQ